MEIKKRKKIILCITVSLLIIIIMAGVVIGLNVKNQMQDLFRLNDDLKAQGYYMGDFEFKMLSFAYYLDKGHYIKALSGINRLHHELTSKEGLLKIPRFNSQEEEMEFYLNLQNPETGAFIDDSYPYCTYNEVTENVLLHLDELARETGRPLKLKYPLRYLDEINTPEELTAFLDDVSQVGWIAGQFPQTSYVFARSLLSCCNGEDVIGRNNLYDFSVEFKKTLLQWFYKNQDLRTGFWGPKSKDGRHLLSLDLNNTASIIKAFVDINGNDIHQEFPLRYKDKMFQTALEVMSEPMPPDEELDEWHEWSLKMGKGTAMLVRYLWKDASPRDKEKARQIFKDYIQVSFEKHYIPQAGAFSYNPGSQNATIDGTGSKIGDLADLGFFSAEKQKALWGDPQRNMADLGTRQISSLSKRDFDLIADCQEVNSVRFYQTDDSGVTARGAFAVVYPRPTAVLDALDLAPKVKHWVETTSQTMGNWTSRETVLNSLASINGEEIPVYEELPFDKINQILLKRTGIVMIGYDVLQAPRYKITFELKEK